jgi:hypothetical protein
MLELAVPPSIGNVASPLSDGRFGVGGYLHQDSLWSRPEGKELKGQAARYQCGYIKSERFSRVHLIPCPLERPLPFLGGYSSTSTPFSSEKLSRRCRMRPWDCHVGCAPHALGVKATPKRRTSFRARGWSCLVLSRASHLVYFESSSVASERGHSDCCCPH